MNSFILHIYKILLGKNERLGLTGRPSFEMGSFSTSKLYTICGRTLAFTPSVNF